MMTLEELLRRCGDLAEPTTAAPAWMETATQEQLTEYLMWIGRWARQEHARYQEEVVRAGLLSGLHQRLGALAAPYPPGSVHHNEITQVVAITNAMTSAQLQGWTGKFDHLERKAQGLDLLIRQLQLVRSMRPLNRHPPHEPVAAPHSPDPSPSDLAFDDDLPSADPSPADLAPVPPPSAPPPPEDRERQIERWVGETMEVAIRPLQATDARWAVDFGTARSKVALRDDQGGADDQYVPKLVFPSLIAVERNGDGIRFGKEAEESRFDAQRWTMVTSLKRLLIGHRAPVQGLHSYMTTERLAVLYLAWLLHQVDQNSPGMTSPLDTPTQLSLPLVERALTAELRDLFDGTPSTRMIAYKDWLPKAFRLGQLVALTFQDESWPTSQRELLKAVMLWEQKPWTAMRRTLDTCSEPAAVMGDRDPRTLAAGLYLLVDCGAGTTDVSVFWNRNIRGELVLTTVIERATIVGGDTVDSAIVTAVVRKLIDAGQDGARYEHTIRAWAREAKLTLLAGQSSTFDPASELGLESELPFALTVKDMSDGLNHLQAGVQEVITATLSEAEMTLLRAKPTGAKDWPEIRQISNAYLVGGSAGLAQVRTAVQSALAKHQIQVAAIDLPKPPRYAGWADDLYRLSAVALGASRPSLQDPAPMPECLDRYGKIGNFHTDHDA